uniref:Protein kinase domain-containing protein n=1 Tax=Caenorhabditis tropicalis TaxID=1561998 RepID=A0A1I7UL37_9PELO
MEEDNPEFIGEYHLDELITSSENIYSDCEVYKATKRNTHEKVILKLSRYSDRGNTELEILNAIRHEFIVNLLDSFKTKFLRNVMIFEKYPRDLQELYTEESLESNRIQKFMNQLMTGIQYIHDKNIIHRDIKPENLMITETDSLKIGDFGISRYTNPTASMTPESVSLWYRPIEILLSCKNHTTAVDIWSAGCVMAELYRRCPLFKGEGQINMINKIINVLGKPTLEEWPTMNELPAMSMIELSGPDSKNFENAIPNASKKSLDLIQNMIMFDPARRFSASQVLQHAYFKTEDISEQNNYEPSFP